VARAAQSLAISFSSDHSDSSEPGVSFFHLILHSGHTDAVNAVAFSPDGATALSASADQTLILWNVTSGDIIRRFSGHTDAVNAVAFSPDGQRVVSGSGDIFAQAKDNTVRVWDVATGQELQQFKGHTDNVWDIDVSADGRFVASVSHDGTLRLWDLQRGQGKILLDVSPQALRSLAFSPDGKAILAGLGKGGSSTPAILSMAIFEKLYPTLGDKLVIVSHLRIIKSRIWR